MQLTDVPGLQDQLARELNGAWAIAKKDMKIYYIKPNIIVAGILFPLFMFFAFALGKNAPLGSLIPGLIGITLLFSASSIEPVSIPIERRMKTFDRLLSAPVSLSAVVFGESLSGFIYSIIIAIIPLLIGILLFNTIVTAPLLIIPGLVLTAFCFSSMGTLFAAYPTENVGEVMSILNIVRLPLIFISGVFIPIEAMPPIGQVVAYISPLTYGNDLIQGAYYGTSRFGIGVDVIAMLAFIIGFQLLGNRLYRKFNE